MAAAIAATALLTASCGVFEKDNVYACPAVFILQDAQHLTRFKPGPGRDITDILFDASIVDFRGGCEYDEDKGKWEAEIELLVGITVERGPANKSREISFEYFAAIPKYEGQPEGKAIFKVRGEFEDTRTRLVYQDELKFTLPLDNPNDGGKTDIVLGFQLTPEELKFNRARQLR